jgi:hypothetical protein
MTVRHKMVALSFGKYATTPPAYSPTIFNIGTPAPIAKSPTDFQYAPAKPVSKSPTDFQYTPAPSVQAGAPISTSRPPLSFGDAVPQMTSLFNKRAELSYGTAVPTAASSGFGSTGFVSNFLNTMSMGTAAPVAKSPTDFQYAPASAQTRQSPIVTVESAGRSGMQEFAQDMAGQIFENMFKPQPAPIQPTLAGGASGTFGGGTAGGGFSGGEIAIAAGALLLVLVLVSSGKSKGGTRRKSTGRARK